MKITIFKLRMRSNSLEHHLQLRIIDVQIKHKKIHECIILRRRIYLCECMRVMNMYEASC